MRIAISPRTIRRALRVAGALFCALTGITCRDASPTGPGLPSRGSLHVAPSLQRARTARGPSFTTLDAVRGVLTPTAGGSPIEVEAPFVNDTARVVFDVTFPGPSQHYLLGLAVTDVAGDTLFASLSEVVAKPGDSTPIAEQLRYVGADTAVATLSLATTDTAVLTGDSIAISALGYDVSERPVTPLYVGWTARDPGMLTVNARGSADARIVGLDAEGETWIIATTFSGTVDSVRVRALRRVASVVLNADSLRMYVGDVATVAVEVHDATGASLDRTMSWSSADTTVASVTPQSPVQPGQPVQGATQQSLVKQATVAAVRPGITRIAAGTNGIADTLVVVVAPPPITTTVVTPASVALVSLGETVQLAAASFANDSSPRAGSYTWALAPQSVGVVTVDGTGLVTALATGVASVIVSESGGTADTASVTVTQIVDSVHVSPAAVRGAVGDSLQLTAKALDARGNLVIGTAVTWSTTGNRVASVSTSGTLSLDIAGLDTVTAVVQGKSTRLPVEVVNAAATVTVTGGLNFDAIGQTAVVRAVAMDSFGKPVPGATFQWSASDPRVVAVVAVYGDSALVRSEGNGGANVVAASGKAVGATDFSVNQIGRIVTVSPEKLLLGIGGQAQLWAVLLDANRQPVPVSPTEIQWTNEGTNGAADADPMGIVTAKQVGTASVHATIRQIRSTSVAIDVSDPAPIILRFAGDTIAMASQDTVTVTLYLSVAYPAPLTLTFTVADGTAKFLADGVVVAQGQTRVDVRLVGVQKGAAVITAADADGKWTPANAVVIVTDGP